MRVLLAALAGAAVAGIGVGLWARSDLARLQAQGQALALSLESEGGAAAGYLIGTGAGAIADMYVVAAVEAEQVAQAQAFVTLNSYGITPGFSARASQLLAYGRRIGVV